MFALSRLALTAALGLAACSAVVPSGAARLAALSPLDADPAAVSVALVLPEGIEVMPGSAKLSLGATRTDTGEAATGEFVLEAAAGDPSAFGADAAALRTFRLSEPDVARMRAVQDRLRGWEAAGVKTRGTLSVALGGCTLGAGPAPDARASVFLRTGAGGSYFPLLDGARIADLGDTQTPSPCPEDTASAGTEGPH